MTKIVYKVRPADYWRIGEHESWFSAMSLKGLHLCKMGTYFAHFKKGDSKRMEYQIEVTKNKRISDEQIDMYKESGWKYVTSYQYFHVFASPQESNAPKLHTNPTEQSYTLHHLSNKLLLSLIVTSLVFALIVGMLAAMWFLDGIPILRLVEGYVIQQTIISLIVLYHVYYLTRAMLGIQALRKSLKAGQSIHHHAPWKKKLQKNTAVSIIFLFSATLPFLQLIKSETSTLPEDDSNLPLVRLADIEQNPMLVRNEDYMEDGKDWANRYSYNWSIFAPVQYESDENGLIAEMKWLDESDTYSPSISSEVYYLRFKALAEPLVSDLIKWHSYGDETAPFVEKKHPDFDRLIIQEEAEKKQLFASKGKVVMYVRYYGYAEIDVLIENVKQKILLLKP